MSKFNFNPQSLSLLIHSRDKHSRDKTFVMRISGYHHPSITNDRHSIARRFIRIGTWTEAT